MLGASSVASSSSSTCRWTAGRPWLRFHCRRRKQAGRPPEGGQGLLDGLRAERCGRIAAAARSTGAPLLQAIPCLRHWHPASPSAAVTCVVHSVVLQWLCKRDTCCASCAITLRVLRLFPKLLAFSLGSVSQQRQAPVGRPRISASLRSNVGDDIFSTTVPLLCELGEITIHERCAHLHVATSGVWVIWSTAVLSIVQESAALLDDCGTSAAALS